MRGWSIRVWELFCALLWKGVSFIPKKKWSQKTRDFLELRDPNHWHIAVKQLQKCAAENPNIAWIHAASAGELLQVVPLLKTLNQRHHYFFFVTYLSPEARPFLNQIPGLAASVALPLETGGAYRALLKQNIIRAFFLVRYDFWPSLLYHLEAQNVPRFLLAATLKSTQKPGILTRRIQFKMRLICLNWFTHLFASNADEWPQYIAQGLDTKSTLVGDPKWHQVLAKAQDWKQNGVSEKIRPLSYFLSHLRFTLNKTVIVFGSPHYEELQVCSRLLENLPGVFILVAPHTLEESHITKIESMCKNQPPMRFSHLLKTRSWQIWNQLAPQISRSTSGFHNDPMEENSVDPLSPGAGVVHPKGPTLGSTLGLTPEAPMNLNHGNLLILDEVGYLWELYSQADIAIIGGGFDGQLHNTLESAALGIPTLFGSQVYRAKEAQTLVHRAAAKTFDTPIKMFQFLSDCVTVATRVGRAEKLLTSEWRELHKIKTNATALFKEIPNAGEMVSAVVARLHAL
jgi:3-deoxy-D-manno-octulosonic-acid transferase